MRPVAIAAALSIVFSTAALAQPATLEVKLGGLSEGRIKPRHAFCVPHEGKSKSGENVSPAIGWGKGPEGTKSFAVIMSDADVPTVFDDANKEGVTISKDLPRREFIHWVLADIAPTASRLPEGADSHRADAEGKRTQATKYGLRGVNDYGSFMKGEFYGYDGPCPPWNDEVLHHYTFTVYALDVPSLGLSGAFTAADARKAMQGHILAEGSAAGTYTQNAGLLK
jgi:Raf kinase inhibitor-like YbhB/YbcL family protein